MTSGRPTHLTTPMRGVFVAGTSTGVGKTFVARGLARAWARSGLNVAAMKPIESGCVDGVGADASALARAAGRPELEARPGFVRIRAPVAPIASDEGLDVPDPATLAGLLEAAAEGADLGVVESAGGLFVPLRGKGEYVDDNASLARELDLDVLLVARNALGVLSDVRAYARAAEQALHRAPPFLGVVLVETSLPDPARDPSTRTNVALLRDMFAHARVPIFAMPFCRDDDDALADAVLGIGLAERVSEACAKK